MKRLLLFILFPIIIFAQGGKSVLTEKQKDSIRAMIGHISVKDYGATGDGFTDDRSAIQATIDQAYLEKKAVFFPSGTYLVGDDMFLQNNSHLIGENAIITIPDGAFASGMVAPLIANDKDSIIIERLTLDGNKTGAGGDEYNGVVMIRIVGGDNQVIRNNVIRNSNYLAIQIAGCNNVMVHNNFIYDTDCGIIFGQTEVSTYSGYVIKDNIIIGGTSEGIVGFPAGGYGYVISDVIISGNYIKGKSSGTTIAVWNMEQVLISDNIGVDGMTGIQTNGCKDVKISGNNINNYVSDAMQVWSTVNLTVTDNQLSHSRAGVYGLNLTNANISNNTLYNLTGNDNYGSISLQDSTKKVMIRQNYIYDNQDSITTVSGIRIGTGTDSTWILDNMIDNISGIAINLQSGANNVWAVGNVGYIYNNIGDSLFTSFGNGWLSLTTAEFDSLLAGAHLLNINHPTQGISFFIDSTKTFYVEAGNTNLVGKTGASIGTDSTSLIISADSTVVINNVKSFTIDGVLVIPLSDTTGITDGYVQKYVSGELIWSPDISTSGTGLFNPDGVTIDTTAGGLARVFPSKVTKWDSVTVLSNTVKDKLDITDTTAIRTFSDLKYAATASFAIAPALLDDSLTAKMNRSEMTAYSTTAHTHTDLFDTLSISWGVLDTTYTGSLSGWKVPNDITITEISAYTDANTCTFNIEERAETTPNSAGTDVIGSDLVADTDQQETSTFTNATIAKNAWLVPTISATGDVSIFTISVRYIKTD